MSRQSQDSPNPFQASVSSLTLGSLYEAVWAFSSQESFHTFWPSVCSNARWLIPSRRLGIVVCGTEKVHEVVGMYERGHFHKPNDPRFEPESAPFRRVLSGTGAQWFTKPAHGLNEEKSVFAAWLLADDPEMLLVVPMRAKGKMIGALFFAMASVVETDQALLSTLGTIYALHVGMSYTLLRVTEERTEMQNQLIMQEKMASLGSLVAGITHEINTPIGALQSASDVVRRCVDRVEALLKSYGVAEDGATDKSYRTVCQAITTNSEIIAAASKRIGEIVRSLKTFARLDEAEHQRADIHEGIESALTLLEAELKDRVKVVKEFGEIPPIDCFPGQLNQVFLSMLKNAGEAIEGPGMISVKTARQDDLITIQISDSGRGIPPEKLKRIFDVDFSRTGPRVKMGFGLATAYNVIRKHQGQISIKSRLGQGSEITITLPVDGVVSAGGT